MKISKWIFLCCALIVVGCAKAKSVKLEAQVGSWRNNQKIWWDTATLIREELIESLKYDSSLQNSDKYEDVQWASSKLMLILDGVDNAKANATLLDLLSFNVGTASHEILTCILLRKGKPILESIQLRLNNPKNDLNTCSKEYGKKNKICIDESDYIKALISLKRNIQNDVACGIEP